MGDEHSPHRNKDCDQTRHLGGVRDAADDRFRKATKLAVRRRISEEGPQVICPNCGIDAAFTRHTGGGRETETGYVDGDYLTCDECGAATDDGELERLSRESA